MPAALVTGAGVRIGRALALALAEDGLAVGVHYNRSAMAAAEVVALIAAQGGRAVALPGDLASPFDAGRLVGAAQAALGPVGVLVNSASAFGMDRLDTIEPAPWQAMIDVNLTAPVVLMQAFANQAEVPAPACIINLLDVQLDCPSPEYFSYFCSKFGLLGATRMAAMALAPRKIRVNAIAPGMVLPSGGQTDAEYRDRQRQTPLGQGLGADDIVAAARYLIAAPQVTGHVLPVDGGQHLMGFGNSDLTTPGDVH